MYTYMYICCIYIYTYTVLVKSSIPDFLNFSALFETCVKTWSIIIIPEQSINHLDLQLFGKPRKAIAFIQWVWLYLNFWRIPQNGNLNGKNNIMNYHNPYIYIQYIRPGTAKFWDSPICLKKKKSVGSANFWLVDPPLTELRWKAEVAMSISVKSSSKPISRVFSQGRIQVLTMCYMFFFAGENPTFVGGIFIFVAERLKPWLTHDGSSNSSISPCHGTMACQSSRAGMAVLAVTWKMSGKSIPGGSSHSVSGFHFFISMDWLKGKSTGNHCFYHQI